MEWSVLLAVRMRLLYGRPVTLSLRRFLSPTPVPMSILSTAPNPFCCSARKIKTETLNIPILPTRSESTFRVCVCLCLSPTRARGFSYRRTISSNGFDKMIAIPRHVAARRL
uniref:Putative secreted protein n=1 Tax=Anopheles triannulatus TaxID=58253 RepID=A0A2M4B2B3_9DIPT